MGLAEFFVNTIAASDLLNSDQRLWCYRRMGMKVQGAYISPHCLFDHPDLSNIYVGEGSFLNWRCHLENGAAIVLDGNVRVGPGVRILTTTHQIGGSDCRSGEGCVRAPVWIMHGCWIGASSLILPGVTIAPGCVIGAGSVVRQSTEPNGLYAGVPAARKRELSDLGSGLGLLKSVIELTSENLPSHPGARRSPKAA